MPVVPHGDTPVLKKKTILAIFAQLALWRVRKLGSNTTMPFMQPYLHRLHIWHCGITTQFTHSPQCQLCHMVTHRSSIKRLFLRIFAQLALWGVRKLGSKTTMPFMQPYLHRVHIWHCGITTQFTHSPQCQLCKNLQELSFYWGPVYHHCGTTGILTTMPNVHPM